jgi:glycosyltransferase involved in cell wall biosynthesis
VKIAHIEAGRHAYGGPRQVQCLLDGLAARGVDNVLVCPPEQPLAGAVTSARVVTVSMGGDHDLGLAPRLARVLAAEAPDVVHVHSRRGADSFGGLAAGLAGVPAVLTRRVDSREPRFWLRLKCRPYAAIVAISHAIAADLARAGLGTHRLRVIPSAVDTTRFRPDPAARARLAERFSLRPNELALGLVAQLIERKGHRFAFDAVAALAERGAPIRLICFGRGPLEAELRTVVRARGLDDRIVFAGFEPDMARWLPGLDALVHPVRREGLGVAVLEAMSAGLPVVAAAAGGLVDVIEDGRDGLLVPAGDATAIATALERLLKDQDLRERLGQAARQRVSRDFSIDAMTNAYAALYRETLPRPAYV